MDWDTDSSDSSDDLFLELLMYVSMLLLLEFQAEAYRLIVQVSASNFPSTGGDREPKDHLRTLQDGIGLVLHHLAELGPLQQQFEHDWVSSKLQKADRIFNEIFEALREKAGGVLLDRRHSD